MSVFFIRLLTRQQWLRQGLRYRLAEFATRFMLPDTYEFVEDFFGYKYRGTLDSYIDKHVYFFGGYELPYLLFFRKILRRMPHPVVLDVGANTGHHSLFFSSCAAEVHAFEPVPELANEIRQRIQENNISNIFVHEIGLGNENKKLPFLYPKIANKGMGHFLMDPNEQHRANLFLRIVRGDEYLQKGISRPVSFIKIDVEGFEIDAIFGLRETIRHDRPIIFLEHNAKTREAFTDDENEVFNIFTEYEVFKLTPPSNLFFIFQNKMPNLEKYLGQHRGDIFLIPQEKLFLIKGMT